MEQQMMDLLKDIQKASPCFVSHSRDEVYRLCDTVSCINQGKMEVIEPVKEFLRIQRQKQQLSCQAVKIFAAWN